MEGGKERGWVLFSVLELATNHLAWPVICEEDSGKPPPLAPHPVAGLFPFCF